MREGVVKSLFQIVLMGIFKSRYYEDYPTDEEMKAFVGTVFPTFHCEGDPVHWKVEKVYYLED